jgi:hypothetical protein
MKVPKEWECSVPGCDRTGTVRDGDVWLCRDHEKAQERTRHLKSMREAYTQSLYVSMVSAPHIDLLKMPNDYERQGYLREVLDVARLAAEVLFEEEP